MCVCFLPISESVNESYFGAYKVGSTIIIPKVRIRFEKKMELGEICELQLRLHKSVTSNGKPINKEVKSRTMNDGGRRDHNAHRMHSS